MWYSLRAIRGYMMSIIPVEREMTSTLQDDADNGINVGNTYLAVAVDVTIHARIAVQDHINNGRLICNIGIAPSRPAEFVIFRVTQFTAEAGGSES